MPTESKAHGARGSVLIFTVVVLAILAMLGTTYMVIVLQSRQASTSLVRATEATSAVQSGLNAATNSIRKMVAQPSIHTLEGIFDQTKATYVDSNPPSTALISSSFLLFGSNLSTDPTSAILFWDPDKIYNNSASAFAAGDIPPFFTISPLATTAYPTGQIRSAGNPLFQHDGSARRFEVDGVTGDFYAANANIKTMQPIGNVRGEYFVWIADLDAKLYAIPQDWGIDTLNTTDPVSLGYANNSTWENQIRESVLHQPAGGQPLTAPYFGINNYGSANSVSPATGTDWNYSGTQYLGPGLADVDINTMLAFPPNSQFRSVNDLSMRLPSLVDSSAANYATHYPISRGALDYYFTVYRDIPDATSNKPFLYVKDHSAAININTAAVEIIAAALSQIPTDTFETDGKTLGTDDTLPQRAWNIAKRIVAKRPFLCRMDFEDFLAAQIASDITSPPAALPDDTVLAADSDSSIWLLPEPTVLIYYSIGRRWGPGRWPEVYPAANNSNMQFKNPALTAPPAPVVDLSKPEISLSQYMEIPGLLDTDPVYINVNTPAYQKKRFRYFYDDATDAPHSAGLISPKEFNNIVNSLTTIGQNDDVQLVETGAAPATPGTVAITPGLNAVLETQPLGDDVIVKHIVLGLGSTTLPVNDDIKVGGSINPGPDLILDTVPDISKGDLVVVDGIAAGLNGIVDSFIPKNRPSYYSYSNDQAYEDAMWAQVNTTLADYAVNGTPAPGPEFFNTETITDPKLDPKQGVPIDKVYYDTAKTITLSEAEAQAIPFSKLYYRRPLLPGNMTTSPKKPPTWGVTGPDDLISWRCMPRVPAGPPMQPVRLSGFYQMAFDDWAPASGGTMMSLGDPTDTFNTYSTAKMTSGHLGNGDVAWSPQFAFRSRFYAVYVLGRGLLQSGSGGPAKQAGERRIEAVYDALRDEIVWQRAPAGNKRALGDP